ncbi:MAG: hypothetical protein AAFY17_16310, partial [Cyanobacteria bacterium J06642_11]
RKVREEELSCISEEDLLQGKLDYQDMERRPKEEEEVVLRAMHEMVVKRGLCLRQPSETGIKLVFPSYFNRDLPDDPGHPPLLVTYTFKGQLEEVYATLVVRLFYTKAFEQDKLWRYAADYRSNEGLRMGFKAIRRQEGAAELGLYFDSKIPTDTKVTFIKYVHEHLLEKAQDVGRQRHYVCPTCGNPHGDSRAVQFRQQQGQKDIGCTWCDYRIPLWDLIEEKFASQEYTDRVRVLETQAKNSITIESYQLDAVSHASYVAGEAGQLFHAFNQIEGGIFGEIEFKDWNGNPSGQRVYLQLKSPEVYSYNPSVLDSRTKAFINIDGELHKYWQQMEHPIMLVQQMLRGGYQWRNADAMKIPLAENRGKPFIFSFEGEPFTALNVQRMRDRFFPPQS